jgi:hypothetical protein
MASDLAEEFRPGSARRYTDDEVRSKAADVMSLYQRTVDGIRQYENS